MSHNVTLSAMRRVRSALEEQRIELEILRQETARLRDEMESLRASMMRYSATWTPAKHGLQRLGAASRDTVRVLERMGSSA